MNVFHFVIWIVAIGCAAGVIQKWLELRAADKKEVEADEVTSGKLDELEDRIRVLERIVTENKFDLKQEINNL